MTSHAVQFAKNDLAVCIVWTNRLLVSVMHHRTRRVPRNQYRTKMLFVSGAPKAHKSELIE